MLKGFKEFVLRGNVLDLAMKNCPECLSDVPIAARRCAFCTSALS